MRVYLDHQAGTPLATAVREAMEPFLASAFGNPSSLHGEGFVAREALQQAREQCAHFLGARTPEEIVFTGNGSEAVNLAIKGAAWAGERRGRHIVLSAVEHPAITESVRWLCARGFTSTVLPVDPIGRIAPEQLGASIREDTILTCIHQANHDIGTIQQVRGLSEICSERGVPLFVDARAAAGWISCNVEELGADLLAISPHRFHGPKGVGVLYRNRRTRIESLVHGGEQEGGLRAGTEALAAAVGAGAAAALAGKDLSMRAEQAGRLQVRTLAAIRSSVEHLHLNGPEPGPERSPANLNFSVEFAEGEALGLMLDVRGVALATGSACVAKDLRVPPVLAAIGLPEALARGNVIISFGKDTTDAEVDFFAETFTKAVRDLREMSPEWEQFLTRKQQL